MCTLCTQCMRMYMYMNHMQMYLYAHTHLYCTCIYLCMRISLHIVSMNNYACVYVDGRKREGWEKEGRGGRRREGVSVDFPYKSNDWLKSPFSCCVCLGRWLRRLLLLLRVSDGEKTTASPDALRLQLQGMLANILGRLTQRQHARERTSEWRKGRYIMSNGRHLRSTAKGHPSRPLKAGIKETLAL